MAKAIVLFDFRKAIICFEVVAGGREDFGRSVQDGSSGDFGAA